MEKRTSSSLKNKYFLTYFSRYSHPVEYLEMYPPPEKLGMTITIPCYNEPGLVKTLESLYECNPTRNPVEVIVLINQPTNPDRKIAELNEYSYAEAVAWTEIHNTSNRKFHIIYIKNIPERHFGVGMARKIVMDEAVHRLARSGFGDGIIVGLDADSLCDPNYLSEIENFYMEHPSSVGATIYYEHPLHTEEDKDHRYGIASYELHLRYLIQALRYAGFPYAFHTLGSCISIRASVYAKQGGMNKRKAGEDFHFLQKIIPLGNFGEINTTRVIPSSRVSNRVPFGTGKAMMKWSDSRIKELRTYNPSIFEELHTLFSGIDDIWNAGIVKIEDYYHTLAPTMKKFLKPEDWLTEILRFQKQSTSVQTFRHKFFQWMNGLNILKYIHFARDEVHKNIPVSDAYNWLRKKLDLFDNDKVDVLNGLEELRTYDKSHSYYFKK